MDLVIIVGTLLSLIRTIPTIIIGRFICGCASGVFNICMSKSISESVPASRASIFQPATNIGIRGAGVICLLLGLTLPEIASEQVNDQNWRLIYGFPLIWATLQLFMTTTIFKYEPINFLIQKGKDDEALQFLPLLYSTPAGLSEKEKTEIYRDFILNERLHLKPGQHHHVSFKEAISSPQYAKASWVCFGLSTFSQLSAIGPVNTFATSILRILRDETNGQFPVSPRNGAFIIGITNLVFAILSVLTINKFGRRTILLYGQLFMTVANALIGVFKVTKLYIPCFIFMLVFIAIFQLSQGSLSFMYVSEVTTDASIGLANAGQFGSMLLMTVTVQFLMDSSLQVEGTFWLYSSFCLAGFIFVLIFIKETKGLTAVEKKNLYRSDLTP